MNRLLAILVTLVWATWIGSLIGVFIAVTSLNKTFVDDRTLFGTAASGVFIQFEKVQLILAAAALLLTFAWRVCAGAPKMKTALFALFALSTIAAVVGTRYVTPKIESMRIERTTSTPEFRKLHGMSMGLYTGTVAILAVGGMVVVATIGRDGKKAIQSNEAQHV